MARNNWEKIVVPAAIRLSLGTGGGAGGGAGGAGSSAAAATITEVSVDTSANSFIITYSDGSAATGTGEFSEAGTPTALRDDAGNEVVFLLGNPIGAQDSQGNRVDITVGGA